MNAAKTAPSPAAKVTHELADEQATLKLAATIARHTRIGDVIALSGDLGAGKTTFARGFIHAKCRNQEDVPSPTFTLVQIYETDDGTIHHFDLYRLNDPSEAFELDIEDAFVSSISLIEWPDKLGSILPENRLEIQFDFSDIPDSRRAIITAQGDWRSRLEEISLG